MLLIALGANLPGEAAGSPLDTCHRALNAMLALPDLAFVAVSRWYRSRPFPPDDRQPDYCNGVARFEGTPDPAALLAALHRIEAALGRTRTVANAARPIDLDLIDANALVQLSPAPILPHPRAHLREFVLRPILDVAPDWVHPATGISGATLLSSLPHTTAPPLAAW